LNKWLKFAFVAAAGGCVLFAVSLIIAIRLSDSTGDRWIPVFRIGQFIGQVAFLVGLLIILIGLLTKLVQFLLRSILKLTE
jgi:hypothetical protein